MHSHLCSQCTNICNTLLVTRGAPTRLGALVAPERADRLPCGLAHSTPTLRVRRAAPARPRGRVHARCAPPSYSAHRSGGSSSSPKTSARVEQRRRRRCLLRRRWVAPSSREAGQRIRRRLRITQATAAADTKTAAPAHIACEQARRVTTHAAAHEHAVRLSVRLVVRNVAQGHRFAGRHVHDGPRALGGIPCTAVLLSIGTRDAKNEERCMRQSAR